MWKGKAINCNQVLYLNIYFTVILIWLMYNSRWICIYPAYLNSKKTLAQGRRLPRAQCVENPTHQEIRDVLLTAGLHVGVENKLYPRERSKVIYKLRWFTLFQWIYIFVTSLLNFYVVYKLTFIVSVILEKNTK